MWTGLRPITQGLSRIQYSRDDDASRTSMQRTRPGLSSKSGFDPKLACAKGLSDDLNRDQGPRSASRRRAISQGTPHKPRCVESIACGLLVWPAHRMGRTDVRIMLSSVALPG